MDKESKQALSDWRNGTLIVVWIGGRCFRYESKMSYAERNASCWKEVYGEGVPYLHWNEAYKNTIPLFPYLYPETVRALP